MLEEAGVGRRRWQKVLEVHGTVVPHTVRRAPGEPTGLLDQGTACH